MTFEQTYLQRKGIFLEALDQTMAARTSIPSRLKEAMEYSLFAGGKRLRPILLIAAHELAGGTADHCMPLACAVEMIHTYSLIHDDLPAMDDDDLRRGKPTSHKVFGEALAILAGDALLNLAYEVILEGAVSFPGDPRAYLKGAAYLAHSAGSAGMIAGQTADMTQEAAGEAALRYIHDHKTGALITGSLCAGAGSANAADTLCEALCRYGEALGLAFQITDDILDEIGDPKALGKHTGRDKTRNKLTYPLRFGLQAAQRMALEETERAAAILAPYGADGRFLTELAYSITARQQ